MIAVAQPARAARDAGVSDESIPAAAVAADASTGEAAPAPIAPIAIDPFGFVPGHISRIGGLGGDVPGPIESYAFHTAYVPLEEGHVAFVLAFDGLVATRGTLDLIVNAMSPRPGAVAHTIEVQQIPLRLLAAEYDGRATVHFEALAGLTYSLFGQISDETDAAAQALSIAVWRRAELDAELGVRIAAQRTEFTAPDVKPIARLVSAGQPLLAEPVSQMCTTQQLAEPVYREWADVLGLAGRADAAGWAEVYVMQALRRYGVLQPGARGLGFAVGDSGMPAAVAALGCTVVATDATERGAMAAGAALSFHRLDPGVVPLDLPPFDFVWSIGIDTQFGAPADVVRFGEEAMACLKPGGLAVHVFNYVPADGSRSGALRRADIERLGLGLISRGHEVAQFKYDAGDASLAADGGTAYGVIARRGLRG